MLLSVDGADEHNEDLVIELTRFRACQDGGQERPGFSSWQVFCRNTHVDLGFCRFVFPHELILLLSCM